MNVDMRIAEKQLLGFKDYGEEDLCTKITYKEYYKIYKNIDLYRIDPCRSYIDHCKEYCNTVY